MYSSLLVGLTVSLGAPAPKEAPKEKPTIVGEWAGQSAVVGGKSQPVPEGGVTFTFTADGKVQVREGNKGAPDEGTYTLAPDKDPAEIDLMPPPTKKDPPALGIYKLDGDTLTLCFHRGDPTKAGRPKKFESPDGSDAIVITLKRVKK